jgi:glycosyltransferase involved in cell wall biosynthesis
MPTTSVIIATRNRPRLLPQAIESVWSAGKHLEVVVVDDASTPETAEVCRHLENIKYVRLNWQHGVANARNAGIRNSSGEYITFLDDDDRRLLGTIDRQIDLLEEQPEAALVYGQAEMVDQQGNTLRSPYLTDCLSGDVFWRLLSRNFIPGNSVIFRRTCLFEVGLLDHGFDDWDLWIRLAERWPIIALEEPVIVFRRATPSSGQVTSKAARFIPLGIRQFHARWMKLSRTLAAPASVRREAWIRFSENMTEHLLFESARALRYRQIGQMLANLMTIRQLHPAALARIAENRVFRRGSRCAIDLGTVEESSFRPVSKRLPEAV